jgi:hypothetical protein
MRTAECAKRHTMKRNFFSVGQEPDPPKIVYLATRRLPLATHNSLFALNLCQTRFQGLSGLLSGF